MYSIFSREKASSNCSLSSSSLSLRSLSSSSLELSDQLSCSCHLRLNYPLHPLQPSIRQTVFQGLTSTVASANSFSVKSPYSPRFSFSYFSALIRMISCRCSSEAFDMCARCFRFRSFRASIAIRLMIPGDGRANLSLAWRKPVG
jgi:hypothetical protein